MMIESNCPTCNQRRKFSETEEKKYKCDICQTTFSTCKNKNCNNMIKLGLMCKECIGKGLKSGGSLALTVGAAVGGIAIKTLFKKGK